MQDNKIQHITPQYTDFSAWYQDVVKVAELAENSQIRGCGIVKPYGYKIWELIKKELSDRIQNTGVQDMYFPILLPMANLEAEKDHVEGFSPELAVVTYAGGEELKEKLAIRPTSEAAIYPTYSKWIKSHRDLPLRLNQWCNVLRWEKRPRPFLRWSEFQWQEGHSVFANKEEALEEMWQMARIYQEVYEWMAVPVFLGRKSEMEKFAGAVQTVTVEAMAKDRKAIQAGTSHYLGENFAKVFDIQYLGEDGQKHYVHQNSWGFSWRSLGVLIMVHGDDRGLRLPPSVAPYQVVIVPIYKDGNKEEVLKAAEDIKKDLKDLRVHIDDREAKTPGFKFNEWEVKGVPLRIEIGMRDMENNSVTIFRRDLNEKEIINKEDITQRTNELLVQIHNNLSKQANDFAQSNIKRIESLDEIDEEGGFFEASWSETVESEKALKEKYGIVSRVLVKNAEDKPPKNKKCFITGEPAKHDWLFAKSY